MNYVILAIASLVPASVFANTNSYDCLFDRRASPEGVERDSFKMVFVVDKATNKAYTVGNAGSSDVEMIENLDGGLSFIERTLTGNVMVTAINFKTMNAVHSRSTVFKEDIVPSQYYGKCIAK